ncbi:lectin C-type domain protein [Cooperia oncophora]
MQVKVPFWIGLTYNDNAYKWNNGEPMHDIDFKQWAAKYPDSQKGDCVKMVPGEEKTGQWFNEFCDKDLLYICQIASCSTDHYCPDLR